MSFIEITSIGLPFCAFKIISGLFFNQYWLTALGIVDLFINGVNLISILIGKKRFLDSCFLAYLVRIIYKPNAESRPQWQDLGNSLDVFLSFALVAGMIGFGFIQDLPSSHIPIWNMAVVLNVFGAGFSRVKFSLENLKSLR